jgi:DNA-binding IclR family transcriptional regulator
MSKAPVDAVETSLEILEELEERGPVGVTALAARLDRPKATVYYHLKTLAKHGYVVEDEDGYELGLRILELGGSIRERHRRTDVVVANLKRLGAETNEMAIFAVREGDKAIVLDVERPTGLTTAVDVTLGLHLPLHASAAGKALLSELPEPELAETLDRLEFQAYTEQTVTAASQLQSELADIRETEHAFDRGEHDPERHSVASPVHGSGNQIIGAIGIVGPASRLYSDRFEHELPHLVERFAERIEYELRS